MSKTLKQSVLEKLGTADPAPWGNHHRAWYGELHAPPPARAPRRVAMAFCMGPSIYASVGAAVKRCGHECVDVQDAPDLIVANWWKRDMGVFDSFPPGVPVVHWWVGSDTHHTTAHSRDVRRNWVVSPWLARLLKRAGVTARVIPIVPALDPCLLPRSPKRRVLVYCPHCREHKLSLIHI